MQPIQQIFEQTAAIIRFRRSGSEGAAKRRGDSGLIGQAFDTDDTAVHVKLGRGILHVSFAGHLET